MDERMAWQDERLHKSRGWDLFYYTKWTGLQIDVSIDYGQR